MMTRKHRLTVFATMFLTLVSVIGGINLTASRAQEPAKDRDAPASEAKDDKRSTRPKNAITPLDIKIGLEVNDSRAFQGYTLINPMTSTTVYLIDMEGRVVHSWNCTTKPALSAYLLPTGELLRPCAVPVDEQPFHGAGLGGRIQKYSWDGELVWDYKLVNETQIPHHDITPLPNGNVLVIVWEDKTKAEAIAAGRRPELVGESLHTDSIYEVKPTGKTTGEIVWEWHAWDHFVQDVDKTKANYGRVASHPELIDVNFGTNMVGKMMTKKSDADKLRDIGYVGSAPTKGPPARVPPDLLHINSVAYNAELDQILLSVHNFCEIWIIDHATTTAEAAGHTGGKRGKGGDILYRWGNPKAYRAGTNVDQKLYYQHDAHWVPVGLPGAGNILIFNNGSIGDNRVFSTVEEIAPPLDDKGTYIYQTGLAYGPTKPAWSYSSDPKVDLFSMLIAGAQRQPNGNTLICAGTTGTVFEVTPESDIVWKYVNPVKSRERPTGPPGMPGLANRGDDDALGGPPGPGGRRGPPNNRFGGPGGPGPGGPGPGGRGPGPGGGPGGRGPGPGRGPGGGGPGPRPPSPVDFGLSPPKGSSLFRAYRYGLDYAAFAGKELTPGELLEKVDDLPRKSAPKKEKSDAASAAGDSAK